MENNPLSKKQWWKQVTARFIISELKNPFVRRVPDRYLRDRAIWKLSQEIDEKTGKKHTATEAAKLFDPLEQTLNEGDRKWTDWKGLFNKKYGKECGTYIQPQIKWGDKKWERWINRYAVYTGGQVRKIVSRLKNRSTYQSKLSIY